MTALAVLQQVDEGQYSLDDHFKDLFPQFNMELSPEEFEQLKVADLLTHQAALVDYTELEGPTTPEGLVGFVKHHDQQPLSHSTTGSLLELFKPQFYPCGLPCETEGLHYSALITGENILTAGNELELHSKHSNTRL